MKKLLIFLMVSLAACTSRVNTEQEAKETVKEQQQTATAPPLNNGSKWKADEATKKNVAKMVGVVNDSIYSDVAKRNQLYATLQTQINTLVNQCSMQGPEHDALHVWLKKVLEEMKELKDENEEYKEVYADLKKDIEKFNAWFE